VLKRPSLGNRSKRTEMYVIASKNSTYSSSSHFVHRLIQSINLFCYTMRAIRSSHAGCRSIHLLPLISFFFAVIARANDITRSSAHASVETPSIRGCKRYRAMTTRQSVESNRIETKEKQPGRMKKNVGTLSLGRRAARPDRRAHECARRHGRRVACARSRSRAASRAPRVETSLGVKTTSRMTTRFGI